MPTAHNRYTVSSRASSRSAKRTSDTSLHLRDAIQVTSLHSMPNSQVDLQQKVQKQYPCPQDPCKVDYWWAPKPRKSKRAQAKLDEELQKPYMNVMYEKRVIRGTNFGPSLMDDVDPFNKAADLRRQKQLLKIAAKYNCKARNQRNVIGTVPPVPGRAHFPVQTDKYLEELVAHPSMFTAHTQTDLFLEHIPIPPYKPQKIGIDVATEIGDGELFHFDAEAQPIIDVLVDASIEYSILEVAQEQEISAIRAEQEVYRSRREAELAELRRLEAEELRLQAEKARRLRQDRIAKELDEEMQRAVVAAKLIQGHVSSLLPEIWENLEPASDKCQKEYLMRMLCPWLSREVAEESKHIQQSRNLLNNMIADIIKERACVYAGYCEVPPCSTCSEEGEAEGLPAGEAEACSCISTICTSVQTQDECGPNDKKV